MNTALHRWIRICFYNVLIVSVLGILMRYKIAFSFPYLQQKFILHAHSHFAFAGWLTQILMTLMVVHLSRQKPDAFRQYRPVLWANLLTAYGMLISFPIQGYGAWSITFSTLNIFTAYWFALKYWRDMNRVPARSAAHPWFRAAVIFNAISSGGAFFLAYMMATKNLHQHWYLAAVYFFLHFQYNGWFFFSGMGLLTGKLERGGADLKKMRTVFILFASACIPAYFLSALWLPIPLWVYILVVASAVAQMIAAWILFRQLVAQQTLLRGNTTGYRLMLLAGIALVIKLLLQLGSTVPSLSDLAFGFRPIVIGYLHLVLLAVISLFIIGFVISENIVSNNRGLITGAYVFTAGIMLNELLLMLQGIAAMSYESIPYMDLSLLVAGVVMFFGLLLMAINIRPAVATPDPGDTFLSAEGARGKGF